MNSSFITSRTDVLFVNIGIFSETCPCCITISKYICTMVIYYHNQYGSFSDSEICLEHLHFFLINLLNFHLFSCLHYLLILT